MKKSVDFIGVGTGPFNLSIAALSHQIEELDCLFFDEHPHFSWHPGMLVPDCHMQTVWPDLDGGSRMLPNYLEDLQNPLWLVTQEYES
ncbi:L-lysine 6-monooxygenase [Escherichia coli UMEA 3899-1]|nr:L-lysine 6-monooxygenase [Escherichia coli UMEA 3899-1]